MIAFTILELFPLTHVIDLSEVFAADDVASGVATAPGVALGRGVGEVLVIAAGIGFAFCNTELCAGNGVYGPVAQYLNSQPVIGPVEDRYPSRLKYSLGKTRSTA